MLGKRNASRREDKIMQLWSEIPELFSPWEDQTAKILSGLQECFIFVFQWCQKWFDLKKARKTLCLNPRPTPTKEKRNPMYFVYSPLCLPHNPMRYYLCLSLFQSRVTGSITEAVNGTGRIWTQDCLSLFKPGTGSGMKIPPPDCFPVSACSLFSSKNTL